MGDEKRLAMTLERLQEMKAERDEARKAAQLSAEAVRVWQGKCDALAAHVERIKAEHEVGAPLGRLERIGAVLNESPETSLARLKAEERKDELGLLRGLCLNQNENCRLWEHVARRVSELRRQAEGE